MPTQPPFDVRSSFTAGVLLVEVSGEVDMSTSPRLAEVIGTASDATERVVVDLSDVTFLDSSGLNALVRGQRQLTARGIALRLVSPASQVVRRVFEIAHLTESLRVVESVDEALS
jgi:anti-anti-sigma factor